MPMFCSSGTGIQKRPPIDAPTLTRLNRWSFGRTKRRGPDRLASHSGHDQWQFSSSQNIPLSEWNGQRMSSAPGVIAAKLWKSFNMMASIGRAPGVLIPRLIVSCPATVTTGSLIWASERVVTLSSLASRPYPPSRSASNRHRCHRDRTCPRP